MSGLNDPFSGGWIARFRNEDELLIAVMAMKKEESFHRDSHSDFGGVIWEWDAVAPWPCPATRLVEGEKLSRFSMKWMSIYGVCGAVLGGVILSLWISLTQVNPAEMIVQGRASGWSSWPGLVPPLFEGILLGAGLGVAVGFLRGARLPEWYYWVFEEPQGRGGSTVSEGGFMIVASSSCGARGYKTLAELNPLSLDVVEARDERGES